MTSQLVLYGASKYWEVKEIFIMLKSCWHANFIYSLVFPVSSNISCFLWKTQVIHLLNLHHFRRSLVQPSALSRVTSDLRLGWQGLFLLGLENLQGKRLSRLFHWMTLLMIIFFFLLMSNHKLLCFSLWFPISHPPAIWKDLFHLLNNLLLVHQMVGVVRDLWQPSDPNTD